MKAQLLDGQEATSRVEDVPDPEDPQRARRDRARSRRPRSAAPTCTSTTASCRRWRRATSSATSSWARSSRSGTGVKNLQGRRPRRRAVPDRVRQLRRVRARQLYSLLRELEPERAGWPRSCWATRRAGIFGYSHLLGGFAGGQAEYARVPFADVGPLKVPDGLTDEQVLFLSDIFPTGYMGAEMCDIKPGDVDRGVGRGPGRPVRDRERVPARRRARHRDRPLPVPAADGARAGRRRRRINYEEQSTCTRRCTELTGGRGPDACIDAVGMEAHAPRRACTRYDRAKQALMHRDRPADRAARGDPGLPQRRHRLGHRRLRRLHRQVPDGRGDEPRR